MGNPQRSPKRSARIEDLQEDKALKFKSKTRLSCFACSLAALVLAGTAQANTVTGSIWENDPTGAGDATPGNVPHTTPNVTFTTTTPISFASGNLYTIGEFLASGNGSTILTGSGELGNKLENTIFDFTGTVSVTTAEMFTAGHDDGLTLVIDDITVIDVPGPTGFSNTTETYNGPTGTFAFELVYGECCGAPGDLSISLPLQSVVTPEPSPVILAGTGLLLTLAGLLRRRRV